MRSRTGTRCAKRTELKDPDFSKQVMDEIIEPNEHGADGESPPLRRPPAMPHEED